MMDLIFGNERARASHLRQVGISLWHLTFTMNLWRVFGKVSLRANHSH